jgi:hypothetical protein
MPYRDTSLEVADNFRAHQYQLEISKLRGERKVLQERVRNLESLARTVRNEILDTTFVEYGKRREILLLLIDEVLG